MKYILIFYMFIAPTLVFASPQNVKQQLDATLETIRSENDVPAMAVGIINEGNIFYENGFGLTRSHQNVGPNTKFRVASITKLFTSQAVMQLVEQGQLNLDDNAAKYIPELEGYEISILELMTHHSGLKDKIKPSKTFGKRSIESYLQQSIEKQGELKKSFEYADLNFNILGAIVEKVSGQSYPNYISDHIVNPLGLSDTGFVQKNSGLQADVEPYINGIILRKARNRPFDPSFFPSEGLVTNVRDLLFWLTSTMNQEGIFLKNATYDEMLEQRESTEWGEIKMGLGWQLYSNEYGKVIQHAGSIKGVKALLIAYPDIQRGIIILSNADKLPRWDIANTINEILNAKAEAQSISDKSVNHTKK